MVKKLFAVTIIFWLIGMSVIPSTGMVEKSSKSPIGREILYVGGSGPGNYTDIQDAIDNASDGDTVFVYNGTYYENVVIDKTVNLIGENRDNTIIDSAGYADVVYISISADWVNISGFTIRNAESDCNGIGVRSNFNSIFDNNIVSNDYLGIYIYYSNNNTISNNNISNNYQSMRVEGSNHNNISGNIISSNSGSGISLGYSSSSNIITGNNISNNGEGIYLEGFSNTITDNIISNNGEGIYLEGSSNVISGNNIISSNNQGIGLWFSNNNIITGNNITSNNWVGIYLDHSNSNTITGNTISNNRDGIYLRDCYSTPNTITGNNISSNNWHGILFEHSSNNVISENTIFSNGWNGIYSYDTCNNNNISGNNICSNNGSGLQLGSMSGGSNTIIDNNICSNNGDGIMISDLNSNTISDNNICSNNGDGIVLDGSSNNTISDNTISSNNGDGIKPGWDSNNNIIYHNNLINNTQNAYDEWTNNWYKASIQEGNYWSDFDEPSEGAWDNDSNGIVDSPYNIAGGDNQDRYPFIEPSGWINSAPNIPNKPSGEILGEPGIDYTYTTSTNDPDNDLVWYKWDWGDGSYSDWLGPYESGEEASATQSWSKGTYQIRVKAKDNRNPETEWSESLTINIIYPNFKTVFLLGQIDNLNESSELSSFNAVKLLWISFNPIFPQIISSNEAIVISNKYFGILRPSFIFGFFNAMILPY